MSEKSKSNKKLTIAIIILGAIVIAAAIFMAVNSEHMIVAPGSDQERTQTLLE